MNYEDCEIGDRVIFSASTPPSRGIITSVFERGAVRVRFESGAEATIGVEHLEPLSVVDRLAELA